MSIRWVIFDAVGTVMYAWPRVGDAYHRIGQQFGSAYPLEDVRARFIAAFQASEDLDVGLHQSTASAGDEQHHSDQRLDADHRRLRTSEEVEEARWKFIVREVFDDVDDHEACFAALFDYFGQPLSWRVYDDVAATFESLARRDIGVAIASNFDRRLHPVCDGHDVLRRADRRFVSSEIGWRKPAVPFFEHVAEQLGCPLSELLFVGDDAVNDAFGATRAGLPAVLIDRSAGDAVTPQAVAMAAMSIRPTQRLSDGSDVPVISTLTQVEAFLP